MFKGENELKRLGNYFVEKIFSREKLFKMGKKENKRQVVENAL